GGDGVGSFDEGGNFVDSEMEGEFLLAFRGADQLGRICFQNAPAEQEAEQGADRRQFPADAALGELLVDGCQVAPDMQMRDLIDPEGLPELLPDEGGKLLQVAVVCLERMERGVPLGFEVLDEGGDLRLHSVSPGAYLQS